MVGAINNVLLVVLIGLSQFRKGVRRFVFIIRHSGCQSVAVCFSFVISQDTVHTADSVLASVSYGGDVE